MNKGIEALEELKTLKGLEALEELKQNNIDDTHMFDYILFDIIEKYLKALEIIKDKKVCVMWLKNGLSSYNSTTALYDLPILTQEEYDLLKEVIL